MKFQEEKIMVIKNYNTEKEKNRQLEKKNKELIKII